MVALVLAAPNATASEEHAPRLQGVWNVSVTVRNCDTGQAIRQVHALNLYIHDGSMTETAANFLRTSSVGTWRHVHDDTYTSMFEFFRYNPDGTFASLARVNRTIELNEQGTRFTSTGTVEDFNAQSVRVAIGCSTEIAARAQ
jgi:hypothetical protein